MGDDQQRAGLKHLTDRMEGLEAQLTQLRRDLNKRQGAGELEQDDTGSTDGTRRWPSPEDQVARVGSLAEWVDALQGQYAAAGDWLVPCWWRHSFAVNELAALHTAWLGLNTSDEPSAALDWHEAAEKCRERIRQTIGDGPGCTAVEHYPDRAVFDNPRWIEECRALRHELQYGSG
jgi:hypothetical protein